MHIAIYCNIYLFTFFLGLATLAVSAKLPEIGYNFGTPSEGRPLPIDHRITGSLSKVATNSQFTENTGHRSSSPSQSASLVSLVRPDSNGQPSDESTFSSSSHITEVSAGQPISSVNHLGKKYDNRQIPSVNRSDITSTGRPLPIEVLPVIVADDTAVDPYEEYMVNNDYGDQEINPYQYTEPTYGLALGSTFTEESFEFSKNTDSISNVLPVSNINSMFEDSNNEVIGILIIGGSLADNRDFEHEPGSPRSEEDDYNLEGTVRSNIEAYEIGYKISESSEYEEDILANDDLFKEISTITQISTDIPSTTEDLPSYFTTGLPLLNGSPVDKLSGRPLISNGISPFPSISSQITTGRPLTSTTNNLLQVQSDYPQLTNSHGSQAVVADPVPSDSHPIGVYVSQQVTTDSDPDEVSKNQYEESSTQVSIKSPQNVEEFFENPTTPEYVENDKYLDYDNEYTSSLIEDEFIPKFTSVDETTGSYVPTSDKPEIEYATEKYLVENSNLDEISLSSSLNAIKHENIVSVGTPDDNSITEKGINDNFSVQPSNSDVEIISTTSLEVEESIVNNIAISARNNIKSDQANPNEHNPEEKLFAQERQLRILADSVPGNGIPGIDYPILSEAPSTEFSCEDQSASGYYADTSEESGCQVFHICQFWGNGHIQQNSFLCPNGTIFNQKYLVCDWWYNFECNTAADLFRVNEAFGQQSRDLSSASNFDIDGNYGDIISEQNDSQGENNEILLPQQESLGAPPAQSLLEAESIIGANHEIMFNRENYDITADLRHSIQQDITSQESDLNEAFPIEEIIQQFEVSEPRPTFPISSQNVGSEFPSNDITESSANHLSRSQDLHNQADVSPTIQSSTITQLAGEFSNSKTGRPLIPVSNRS